MAARRGVGELYAAGEERWGLDYESLRELKKDIILFSGVPAGPDRAEGGVCGFSGCRRRRTRASTT